MSAPLDVVFNQDYIYGMKTAPIEPGPWLTAMQNRVSLWIPDHEWDRYREEFRDWPQEAQDGTFLCELWQSRLRVQAQTEIPYESLRQDLQQQRRRCLVHNMEKAGLLQVRRSVTLPSDKAFSLFLDGGGSTRKQKGPLAKQGGSAWSCTTPTHVVMAEGGVPIFRMGKEEMYRYDPFITLHPPAPRPPPSEPTQVSAGAEEPLEEQAAEMEAAEDDAEDTEVDFKENGDWEGYDAALAARWSAQDWAEEHERREAQEQESYQREANEDQQQPLPSQPQQSSSSSPSSSHPQQQLHSESSSSSSSSTSSSASPGPLSEEGIIRRLVGKGRELQPEFSPEELQRYEQLTDQEFDHWNRILDEEVQEEGRNQQQAQQVRRAQQEMDEALQRAAEEQDRVLRLAKDASSTRASRAEEPLPRLGREEAITRQRMLKEEVPAIWGTLEITNVTGEMMGLLGFMVFVIRHFHNPWVHRIFRAGKIRIVYDNKVGYEAAMGSWLSRAEGPLGFVLRKGTIILRNLGLQMEPFWQPSHGKGDEDWMTKGNGRADFLVHYVRAAGAYFARLGRLALPPKKTWPESWEEEGPLEWDMPKLTEGDFRTDQTLPEPEADQSEVEAETAENVDTRPCLDDWLVLALDGCVDMEDEFRDFCPWRPGLFREDLALKYTQRYFQNLLRSSRWTTGGILGTG